MRLAEPQPGMAAAFLLRTKLSSGVKSFIIFAAAAWAVGHVQVARRV